MYYRYGVGNITNAGRYWLPNMFNVEVDEAAAQDLDLYPVYVNNSNPTMPIWVGPGPNNTVTAWNGTANVTVWNGTTKSQIAALDYGRFDAANNLPIGASNLPMGVAVDALCEAGCYSPEQEIRIGDTFVPVAEAHSSREATLTTLTPGSTIDSIHFMANRIARWTVDIAPAYQTIITLRMESGGQLRVTPEHPLLTSEGVMKRTVDLALGESLVQEDGSPDAIVSMVKSTEFTKVYNLRPTSTDLTSNILVAQGYLTGSARYQNEYLKYLNRVLFRHQIPLAIIPRAPKSHPL
jgi:hypothetical protein